MIKRIIGGKTYNTETATRIARYGTEPPTEPGTKLASLYQNRHGAYFIHEDGFELEDEIGEWVQIERVIPLSSAEAQAWLEKYVGWNPELIEAHFGEMPEAGTGEVKFTLRMPESLKRRLDVLATRRRQSLNAWIVRCIENCARLQEEELERGAGR
jgi:predicted HicB family RNase H-like nuclease